MSTQEKTRCPHDVLDAQECYQCTPSTQEKPPRIWLGQDIGRMVEDGAEGPNEFVELSAYESLRRELDSTTECLIAEQKMRDEARAEVAELKAEMRGTLK